MNEHTHFFVLLSDRINGSLCIIIYLIAYVYTYITIILQKLN